MVNGRERRPGGFSDVYIITTMLKFQCDAFQGNSNMISMEMQSRCWPNYDLQAARVDGLQNVQQYVFVFACYHGIFMDLVVWRD